MQQRNRTKEQVIADLSARSMLGQSYEQFMMTDVGNDLKTVLNQQYEFYLSQILLEDAQRQDGMSTDSLRGRLAMIQLLYNHINARISEGRTAAEQLAEKQVSQ